MMRWEDLQYREKIALALGAAALGLTLLYLLAQPLLNKRAHLRDKIASLQSELVWMRNAAGEINRIGAASTRPATISPLKLIDQTARANNLDSQLKRVEPGTGNEIKVWMENVIYVDLIRWIRQLAVEGQITIVGLSVEKSGDPGRVNARLTYTSIGDTP